MTSNRAELVGSEQTRRTPACIFLPTAYCPLLTSVIIFPGTLGLRFVPIKETVCAWLVWKRRSGRGATEVSSSFIEGFSSCDKG